MDKYMNISTDVVPSCYKQHWKETMIAT